MSVGFTATDRKRTWLGGAKPTTRGERIAAIIATARAVRGYEWVK